jgi:RNA recognition motif-containing protein
VDFDAPDEAARALREKDHKVFHEKFGDRYVRLIQVSRKEMQATLALRFGGEGILKVKGIPFKASANDVRKFFSGYKIKPDGVSFIMHQDGRPTGMAFIEFETPQEAVRAMDKDRAKFGPEYGDRFCMLQLVGRHEMDKVTLQRESESAGKMMVRAGAWALGPREAGQRGSGQNNRPV